jgi:hypothetical protein
MKKRTVKWSLISLSVLVAVVLGMLIWHQRPITHEFYTDADTIRTPRAAAHVRDVLWQPPVKLSEIINTSTEDYEPRISWDGLTLFFVRGKAGENADIYCSHRTPTGWTEPQPLAEINSPCEDLGPEPTADGTALYFYSDRPGGHGGYDLWVAQRTDQGWQPAANLGPLVNSEYNDYGPALTPDGQTLYFASNRPQPSDTRQPNPDAWPATVREDLFRRTYDLFAAPITLRGPGQAEPVAALNTPYNEGAPCVSPAGDFVYFSSDRPGGVGGFDVYRARCIHAEFESPTNLGPTLNTAANELDPGLTHLGYAIYFSSDRPLERLQPDKPNDYNLYYTSSREVFLDTESEARPPIDWAALWRQVLPNLLWALLALLLLLLLWALVGSFRDGKLSLLARCLLASLMLHLLLMTALNFWKVTASVVSAFRERGEIRVALAAPARGRDLAAQIRGPLTEVTPPEMPAAQLARPETPLEVAQFDAVTELAADRNRLDMPTRLNVQLVAHDAPQREPETSLPPPEVGLSRESALRLLDLALPTESRRIDGDESQLEVQMASLQETLLTRPALPVPTSQPVDASNEVSLAPARPGSDMEIERVHSMAAAPTAPDAAPQADQPVPSPTYLAALDNLPALEVALPADSEPEQEVAESSPRVAPAATDLARRASLLLPADHSAQDPHHDVAPPETLVSDGDFAPAAAAEFAPTEASPRATPSIAVTGVRPEEAAPPRIGLALPTLEEVRFAEPSEKAPQVAAVRSTIARPPVMEQPARRSATLTASPVALAPEAETRPEREARSLFSSDLATRTADARVSTPMLAPSSHSAGRPRALAFDVRLPDELEPPARGGHPGHSRARLSGRVTDAATGEPLAGATVHLDLPDTDALAATTDDQGYYALAVPPVPDNFALSASHEEYVPASVNIPAAALGQETLLQDFELEPHSEDVVAVEVEPTVHHLGNDRWEGAINSQFQKTSEGRRFTAEFALSRTQLHPHYSQAAVTLLAKGVQCPHQIYVNGFRLRQRLDSSPSDGSFGEFSAPFPTEILVEGINTIQIRGVSCMGDVDDFEFVNTRIRLAR